MITSTLSARTMSAFMLSIGTSLSFESLFTGTMPAYDPLREIPNKIDIHEYDEIWINLLTLFRNIYGSVPSVQASRLLPEEIADTLAEEVETILEIVKANSHSPIKVVFYTSDYADLSTVYKHAKIRGDSTEKQKSLTALAGETLTMFYKSHKLGDMFKHFRLHINNDQPSSKIIILTHYAIDLLSYDKFTKMDLLESHTGVLKERHRWHTKFIDGKNLTRIPFNRLFLQVFGDSQTFHPMGKDIRSEILNIAEQYDWNPLTTKDRLRVTMDFIRNPYMLTILKEMQ